jgi:hypothetical protein
MNCTISKEGGGVQWELNNILYSLPFTPWSVHVPISRQEFCATIYSYLKKSLSCPKEATAFFI